MAKETDVRINILPPRKSQINAVIRELKTSFAKIDIKAKISIDKTVLDRVKTQLTSKPIDIKVNVNPKALPAIKNISTAIKQLDADIKNVRLGVKGLSTDFANLNSTIAVTTQRLKNNTATANKATASQARFNRGLKESTNSFEKFGELSALALKRFSAFTISTGVVFGLVYAFKNAVSEAINFDKELVKIGQVSLTSSRGLKGLTDQITNLAVSLGLPSRELLDISLILAQTGRSARETRIILGGLAKSALSPTFGDIKNTTEGVIASLAQFNLQASETESILGSINKVAAQFPVEADDIISAIRKAGGVFAAGSRDIVDSREALNEFIATFTSVRATTRESADSIATGLRTIFTRIQRPKTIELLRQFGIELTDSSGKFVGLYNAVELLGQGLDGLVSGRPDVRIAKIVEELGGFRQVGKTLPLLTELKKRQDALTVARQGTNSLDADVIRSQEALSRQLEKVRENFTALIREIVSSDAFKVLVRQITEVANTVINLARVFKSIVPLLAVFGVVRALPKITSFASGFRNQTRSTRGGVGGGFTGFSSALGFATGGRVGGTGKGDKIPAMLEPGEYVIPGDAARRLSPEFLEALRQGKVRGFADGGSVGGGGSDFEQIASQLNRNLRIIGVTVEGQKKIYDEINGSLTRLKNTLEFTAKEAEGVKANRQLPIGARVSPSSSPESIIAGANSVAERNKLEREKINEAKAARRGRGSNATTSMEGVLRAAGIVPSKYPENFQDQPTTLTDDDFFRKIKRERDSTALPKPITLPKTRTKNIENDPLLDLTLGETTQRRRENENRQKEIERQRKLAVVSTFPEGDLTRIDIAERQYREERQRKATERQQDNAEIPFETEADLQRRIRDRDKQRQRRLSKQVSTIREKQGRVVGGFREPPRNLIAPKLNKPSALEFTDQAALNLINQGQQPPSQRKLKRLTQEESGVVYSTGVGRGDNTIGPNLPRGQRFARRLGIGKPIFGMGGGGGGFGAISNNSKLAALGGAALLSTQIGDSTPEKAAASSGIQGALAGGGLGSIAGPAGMAIGAVVGGLTSAVAAFNEKLRDNALDKFNKSLDEVSKNLEKNLRLNDVRAIEADFKRLAEQSNKLFAIERENQTGLTGGITNFVKGTFSDITSGGVLDGAGQLILAGFGANRTSRRALNTLSGNASADGLNPSGSLNPLDAISNFAGSPFNVQSQQSERDKLIQTSIEQQRDVADAARRTIEALLRSGRRVENLPDELLKASVSDTKESATRRVGNVGNNEDLRVARENSIALANRIRVERGLLESSQLAARNVSDLNNNLNTLSAVLAQNAIDAGVFGNAIADAFGILGGGVSVSTPTVNPFANFRGLSQDRANSEIDRITNEIPEIGFLSDALKDVKSLENALPRILENAQRVSAADPNQDRGLSVISQIRELGLSAPVSGAVIAGLQAQIGTTAEGTQDFDEFIRGFDIENFSGEIRGKLVGIFTDVQNQLNEVTQNYVNSLNQQLQAQVGINSKRVAAEQRLADSAVEIARLRGREVQLGTLQRPVENQIRGLNRNNTLDVNNIGQQIAGLLDDRTRLQEGLRNSPNNRQLINALAVNSLRLSETQQSLELLANDTRRLANVQSIIQRQQQKEQFAKSTVEDLIFGGPEAQVEFRRRANLTGRALNGDTRGMTGQDLRSVTEFMRFIGNSANLGLINGQQAGVLPNQDIESVIGQILAPIASAILPEFNQGQLGNLLGGKPTGGTEALIGEFNRLSQEQAVAANKQLEIQQRILNATITDSQNQADRITNAIREGLSGNVAQKIKQAINESTLIGVQEELVRELRQLNKNVANGALGALGGAAPVVANSGGFIPGSGPNRDTVPAMLTKGEFVVNRQATAENFDLLAAINNGYARGGRVRQRGGGRLEFFRKRVEKNKALRESIRAGNQVEDNPFGDTGTIGGIPTNSVIDEIMSRRGNTGSIFANIPRGKKAIQADRSRIRNNARNGITIGAKASNKDYYASRVNGNTSSAEVNSLVRSTQFLLRNLNSNRRNRQAEIDKYGPNAPINRRRSGGRLAFNSGGSVGSVGRKNNSMSNNFAEFKVASDNLIKSITPFIQSINNFSNILKDINIPNSIEMSGRHTLIVELNGASVLSTMQESLRSLVMTEINKAISKHISITGEVKEAVIPR
jgi:TP901 family phage tail tape measure protein